jgi:hypothetical protein
LTPRDVAILHAVARYRFLSSTLIIRLAGGSSQQILRRLHGQRWLHKFGQCGKWNFCLTTGTLVLANQERQ